ncbi:calcium/sodium antiporter [Thiocystis violacea]|uniref:calcium/sodium antiporter n=1 Tax=Thiocystis violacea TaxID=13725 RepID=UPI0019089837|nr:calcium/sodium antiporter [Thiocystis violacea]MBK1717751.1 sodium:calcium antiporter [Thiocystis violacea]
MPEWILSLILVIIGFLGLVGGGEYLVRSASALASAMRVSPLVIGLTVVAFGTSAPELAVTVQSAWSGAADIALGNVVGSNIANVLLVLGLSAVIAPLAVHSRIVRIDVPLVIVASVGLWFMASRHGIGHLDAGLLFLLLVAYVAWSVRQGQREAAEVREEFAQALGGDGGIRPTHLLIQVGWLLTGLVLLAVGARLLVMGAVDIALALGVDELVIGLTLVAVGTSLPELMTSVIASLRGNRDIAVGNVVGSNLFNILGVLGIGALVAPGGIPVSRDLLTLDMPIMIATALLCLPIFFTGRRIDRLEGAVFLAYFLAYIGYVLMRSTDASFTREFEVAMLGFVIPLTLLAIGVSLFRSPRKQLPD